MKKTLFTASCVLVALSGLGAAATYQWTGNGDGSSWTDADNWTEAGVPPTTLGAGNSIIINSDASISTAGAGSLNYRNVDQFVLKKSANISQKVITAVDTCSHSLLFQMSYKLLFRNILS